MDVEMESLIDQACDFFIRLEQWKNFYYLKAFDVNGKSGGGITDRQYQILRLIEAGVCKTLSELETTMCISVSSLSITVSKMAGNGLLKKSSPCQGDDRRRQYISITPKGLELLLQADGKLREILTMSFSKLEAAQRSELFEYMGKVSKLLS